jgi:hypothetical protein
MEGLIRLVSESFVRHGLEADPVADQHVSVQVASPSSEPSVRPFPAPPTEVLPEHNYRKMLEAEPVT